MPEGIADNIIEFMSAIPVDVSKKEWYDKQCGNQINSVSDVSGIRLPDNIQDQVTKIYSSYFNQPIVALSTKFQNLRNEPAVLPPHCDRFRQISINYILQSGGSRVTTCFYKQKRKSASLDQGENATYDEVELDYQLQLPERQWHSYDVQTYHSVAGIENTRIFLLLLPASNPNLDEFCLQYSNIISGRP